MARTLQLPARLTDERYFVVRYDRELDEYELCLPNRDESHSLGEAAKARAYFAQIGMERLGGRAMDAALAFGASQAVVAEGRAWGLDLTDPRMAAVAGKSLAKSAREESYKRLLGREDDDEERGEEIVV